MADRADAEQLSQFQQANLNITFREGDIARISEVLMDSFRNELRGEMSDMIQNIISGVLSGLILSLTEENLCLKSENDSLKTRVQKLESAADVAKQYSRRNCLRVSGMNETTNENTDELILGMTRALDIEFGLHEIDRSHRVGKPNNAKPRDIIVKLSTFRVRQKLYSARKQLKDQGYEGVFINEDLWSPL